MSSGGRNFRGQFGRRKGGSGWLSPEAYDALSPEEKRAIWLERKRQPRRRQNRRKPRRRFGWLRYQLLVAAGAVAVIVGFGVFNDLTNGMRSIEAPGAAKLVGEKRVRDSFGFCHTGGGYNCVVDGDTIWLEGQNIRIADIDAPETHEWRCPEEKTLGDRATQRLLQLVNGGAVSLKRIDRDADNYGRKLRLVYVDGTSVGDTLVDEGLARWYAGGRRPWC